MYLARDLDHDRQVAIKMMRPELAHSLDARRFVREMRLTATLEHPRIVPVLDADAEQHQLFFVLPYMDGGTLRQRLTTERQLTLEDATAIAQSIAEALAYAHGRGVIHRDVKPENILFNERGAHLADFGIARAVETAIAGDTSTSAGVVRGTVAYMSPEQATGSRTYDGRSDVFSLGCVLYEMVAGVAAYVGPTAESVLAQRLTHAPRELRIYRPSVPEALEAAITKALAIAPADRFRSADEMAHALAAVAETLPRLSSRERIAGRRRIRGAAIAAVLGFAALTAVATQVWNRRPTVLDDALVAVAPFDVIDARHALWREGFMDILAGSLDGAGRLRTVSPSVVARRWAGRVDHASAQALASATHARYVVLGHLMSAGTDSIRATATIYDALRRRERNEIDVRAVSDRVDHLVDSLGVRLVGELGELIDRRTRPGSLGASSLPALKAYLRGEYFLRRTQWDSAAIAYTEAIALDPAFALANWRMKTASWSRSWGPDTVGDSYALLAGRLNHGLAPRESLLITVDSLWASLQMDQANRWPRVRRLARTLDAAAERYPDDPWVWYKVGEARFHLPIGLDYPLSEHLAAFDRAIAVDSGFALAYVSHAVELALMLASPERALRYTKGYQIAAMPGVEDSAHALTERLIDRTRATNSETARLLNESSADVLYRVITNLAMWFDSSETAVRLARRLPSVRRGTPRFLDPQTIQLRVARTLAVRGHLGEAATALVSGVNLEPADDEAIELFGNLAAVGAISRRTADSVFRLWMRSSPRGVVFALPAWSSWRDTIALSHAVKAFNAWSRSAEHHDLGAYGSLAAGAYGLLARGDSSAALARLSALTDSLCADCFLDWLTRGELAMAAGAEKTAKREFERVMTYAWNVPAYVTASAHLGRVAERLGERDLAVRSFRAAAAAWRQPDAVLTPVTAQSTSALRRLLPQ